MICSCLTKKQKQPFYMDLRQFAKIAYKAAFSHFFSLLWKSYIFQHFWEKCKTGVKCLVFANFCFFLKKRLQNAVFRMFDDFFVLCAWIKQYNCGKDVKYIVFHCLVVILRNGYDMQLFEQKAKIAVLHAFEAFCQNRL